MKYYCEERDQVLASLNSGENGLSSEEAEKRLSENGKNKLAEPEKESLFKKFIRSLADPMIIMLIVAAGIQAVVTVLEAHGTFRFSDFADVLVILVVVIINTMMSLIQESADADDGGDFQSAPRRAGVGDQKRRHRYGRYPCLRSR